MAQLTVPIAFDHDDLQRMVDEKIAEVKAQFIPKDQYEQRLKADMVAMLTELQLEIEETAKDAHINAFMNGYKDMYLNGISASAIKCSEIIQEKINSLKEGTDGENNN